MLTLSDEKHFFAFSKENEPVLRIKSDERVKIKAMDAFSNQVRTEEDELDSINWDLVNPATGPIYVEGAQPGDVLKVTIEKIKVGTLGVMATGEDLGVFGSYFNGMTKKLIPIEGDFAIFNERLKIPLNKMIGVIGVAPEGEPVNCGTPGSHGGNMDTKLITEGASVLLPVFTEGALFGAGDVHAAMGDGEVCVTGVEIDAELTLKFEVIKDMTLNNPMVETDEMLSCIASEKNLEDAALKAARDMYDYLNANT
ncbi:MAG: amidase, partial [Thermotogaceae bacterium]|nr:amidase [Thermotogaceae bacterium]